MSKAAKVHEFLNKAKVFYFLTTDGDQPKGRPFGFQMLVNDTLYFGCGTFKNVFKQLTKNPKVEILAVNGGEFLRYDGQAKVVKDAELQINLPVMLSLQPRISSGVPQATILPPSSPPSGPMSMT